MVLQVFTHAGQIMRYRDIVFAQMIGGADAGEHQQLRRGDGAGREDDFAPRFDNCGLAADHAFHANGFPAIEAQLVDEDISFDGEVGALLCRFEIGFGGTAAHAIADIGLRQMRALLQTTVVVVGLRQSPGLARAEEAVIKNVIAVALDDAHRAIVAALRRGLAEPGLEFFEIGQAVRIGPALEAKVFPAVIIFRVAAHPDHAIDRRTSAKATATGLSQAAIVQMRFRLARVAPVIYFAFNRKRQSRRHTNGQRIGNGSCLQQAHGHIFLRRKAVGQNTTRRACTDDHIIKTGHVNPLPLSAAQQRRRSCRRIFRGRASSR